MEEAHSVVRTTRDIKPIHVWSECSLTLDIVQGTLTLGALRGTLTSGALQGTLTSELLQAHTHHCQDLFNTCKSLLPGEVTWQLDLGSQGEVLPHCQLLIVGCGQLEDVASVGYVPVFDLLNR